MQNLLKSYQKRLTNFTSANRSLLLLRPPKSQFIDLHSFDFVENKPSFELVSALIAGKKKITLCPHIDPRSDKSNELSKQLRQISRTDQMLRAERGAEDLYVGYPIIKGKLLDGTPIRCPLLFFPVDLSLQKNNWVLEQNNGEISLNRSFLLAYSHFNKVKIDDEWLEKDFEDFHSETRVFLTELYETIKNSPVKVNFNSDIFLEKLEPFQFLKTEDLELEKTGELKLYPQAVLGIFPQAGSYIASDYDYLINQNIFSDPERFFGKMEEENFSKEKEEHLRLPLAVDATQELAISMAKQGKSLVVQGPPGTGKSQLICNLMADFAARGKKVLLVCQKRAAIDTVYNRLSEVGMQPFAALVHDFKADRKNLFLKINDQIEKILAYKHLNQSLNAIFLEREFDAICRKIDGKIKELVDFKSALFDNETYGKSPKELYLLAKGNEKQLNLNEHFRYFHFDTLSDFLQKTDTLEKYGIELAKDEKGFGFWDKRKDFSRFGIAEIAMLRQAIMDIADCKSRLSSLNVPFELENTQAFKLIHRYRNLIIDDFDFGHFKNGLLDPDSLEQLKKSQNGITELVKQNLPVNNKKLDSLRADYQLLETHLAKRSNFFKRFTWNLFNSEKDQVRSLLREEELDLNNENIAFQMGILSQIEMLREFSIKILGKEQIINAHDLQQIVQNRIEIQELAASYRNLHFVGKTFFEQVEKAEFDQKTTEWLDILELIDSQKENWNKCLSDTQVQDITPTNEKDLLNYLERQFENLCAHDKLFDSLTASEKSCFLQTKNKFEANFAENFQQNLIIHFLEDLEQKNPQLRDVSSLKIKIQEDELQQLISKKQALAKENLLIKLRENTYRNIEKNRLGNATTYRDLQHQVSKKKQLWPVRKIIEAFDDELFDLIPCWMASPETVSALFPLSDKPFFDLVIFDEASQCYAENGLPAMLRGVQVVIAGDSKQLQPNDLYRIRFEEESGDETLLEIESLLQLGAMYLPQTMLKGHYRSKSLDLIDFSNQHFYKNNLQLLPHFEEINNQKPGINYLKVDGLWQNNTNEVEANKVLDLVINIRKSEPEKSIGIVTFNFHQAELIAILCENIPHITVKNIENIQGDEFDIVIFSIGYGPNEKGKVLLNFGTLNRAGGENRLNVAVSRAKEKIYLIASIWPEDLSLADTAAEGAKLLKSYLQFARMVSEGNYIPRAIADENYRFDLSLKSVLQSNQHNLTNELPFADLVEKTENQYGEILLTDDDQFYHATSIKESFAYLPVTLRSKGWKFRREWSRNFWLKK